MGLASSRRHDRVAAGGIDLSGASAGDHCNVGVCANDGNGTKFGSIERELRLLVPEQHGALLGNFLSDFKSADDIHDALLRGIIDHSADKHGTQDAADVVIPFCSGTAARTH